MKTPDLFFRAGIDLSGFDIPEPDLNSDDCSEYFADDFDNPGDISENFDMDFDEGDMEGIESEDYFSYEASDSPKEAPAQASFSDKIILFPEEIDNSDDTDVENEGDGLLFDLRSVSPPKSMQANPRKKIPLQRNRKIDSLFSGEGVDMLLSSTISDKTRPLSPDHPAVLDKTFYNQIEEFLEEYDCIDLEEATPETLLDAVLDYLAGDEDTDAMFQPALEYFRDLDELLWATDAQIDAMRKLSLSARRRLKTFVGMYHVMRSFKLQHYKYIRTRKSLVPHVLDMYRMMGMPSTVQLLSDEDDLLLLRHPMGNSLEWAQPDYLDSIAFDISICQAVFAYLVVFTPDHSKHPSEYDMLHLPEYIAAAREHGCVVKDMLFIGPDGYTSLRNLDMLPEAIPIRKTADHQNVGQNTSEFLQRIINIHTFRLEDDQP